MVDSRDLVKRIKEDPKVLEKVPEVPAHVRNLIADEAGYDPAKVTGGYEKPEEGCDFKYHN